LALFHTLFNVTGVAVFWPWQARLARWLQAWLPDRADPVLAPDAVVPAAAGVVRARYLSGQALDSADAAAAAVALGLRHLRELCAEVVCHAPDLPAEARSGPGPDEARRARAPRQAAGAAALHRERAERASAAARGLPRPAPAPVRADARAARAGPRAVGQRRPGAAAAGHGGGCGPVRGAVPRAGAGAAARRPDRRPAGRFAAQRPGLRGPDRAGPARAGRHRGTGFAARTAAALAPGGHGRLTGVAAGCECEPPSLPSGARAAARAYCPQSPVWSRLP